jgi:hypothetical protein
MRNLLQCVRKDFEHGPAPRNRDARRWCQNLMRKVKLHQAEALS